MKTRTFTWRLITYRPGLYFFNFILWTVFHSIPVLFGVLAKGFFDSLSGEVQTGLNTWTFLVLIVVISLSRMGVFFIALDRWSAYWFRVTALLRENLLAGILRNPGAQAVETTPGEAVSRFRDDVPDVAHASERIVDFGGHLLFVVLALVIMLRINWLITLAVLVPLIAVVVVATAMRPRIKHYRRQSRKAGADVTQYIGETFNAVLAVRVAGATSPVLEHFDEINATRREAALKDTAFSEILRSVFYNVVNIGTGIILLMAALMLRNDGSSGLTFTVGDFALFVGYLPAVTGAMFFFGNMLADFQRAHVSFSRLNTMLMNDDPESLVTHTPVFTKKEHRVDSRELVMQAQPLRTLDVKRLTYMHPKSGRGIENISFSLQRGDFVVVTGRVGAGKTTLLRTLLGLLPHQSGEISWNGSLIEDPANFFVPPHSAYTPQVPRLFSQTLSDNIVLGLDGQIDLPVAIDAAVMHQDIATLDKGLETLVGSRGVKLSGGQMQRSAAARMFVRKPDLLVFDDLSSALDVETEQKLWQRLTLHQHPTCLVVSHRHAALRRADFIILLKDGHVHAAGRLDELLTTSAEVQAIWHGDDRERA